METPSEALTKKCHSCEVVKPVDQFITFVSGRRTGDIGADCAKCCSRQAYPPANCAICGELRAVSDFDKTAAGGRVCKACLMESPDSYAKRCTECEAEKTVSSFYKQGRTRYVYPACKICETTILALKKRMSRGRERTSELRSQHSQRIKAETFMAYGGPLCRCCGEYEPAFLTLDHINDDGAMWRRVKFGAGNNGAGLRTYEWCKRNGYPPIFQVLCWNCQHGKRRNNGACPHQGTCRDQDHASVGSSEPKPLTPHAGDDMTRSSGKPEPATIN